MRHTKAVVPADTPPDQPADPVPVQGVERVPLLMLHTLRADAPGEHQADPVCWCGPATKRVITEAGTLAGWAFTHHDAGRTPPPINFTWGNPDTGTTPSTLRHRLGQLLTPDFTTPLIIGVSAQGALMNLIHGQTTVGLLLALLTVGIVAAHVVEVPAWLRR